MKGSHQTGKRLAFVLNLYTTRERKEGKTGVRNLLISFFLAHHIYKCESRLNSYYMNDM